MQEQILNCPIVLLLYVLNWKLYYTGWSLFLVVRLLSSDLYFTISLKVHRRYGAWWCHPYCNFDSERRVSDFYIVMPLWLVTLWTSSLTELWACRYEGQISSNNIEIGIIRPDREFRYDIWKHSLTPFAYVEDPTSIPLALCGCFYIFVSALCFDHIPLCLLSSCSLSNRQNIYLVAKYSFMYRFLCILIEFIRPTPSSVLLHL